MSRLNTPEKVGLSAFVLLVALVAGLPVLLGFFTSLWIAQFGSFNEGELPWIPILVIAFMNIIVILGENSDRIVENRSFRRSAVSEAIR